MSIDKAEFWNKKILKWERDKYSSKRFFDFNASVKARKEFAAEFIKKYGVGLRVLEIGCGSGTLLQLIRDTKIKSYTGIDISSVAISEAKKRNFSTAFSTEFQNKTLTEIEPQSFDLIISLGLIDWLTDSELKKLFQLSKQKIWLHSFSSASATISKNVHKLYVYIMYGRRNSAYVPKYWSAQDLIRFSESDVELHSSRELGMVGFLLKRK